MSFYEPKTIQDLQNSIASHSDSISKLQDYSNSTFQITKGVIKDVSKDRTEYEVHMPKEDIVITEVPLFFGKAHYSQNGFPNVGDVVKVLHKNAFTTAFILSITNNHEELIMDKNSSIAMGVNIP